MCQQFKIIKNKLNKKYVFKRDVTRAYTCIFIWTKCKSGVNNSVYYSRMIELFWSKRLFHFL